MMTSFFLQLEDLSQPRTSAPRGNELMLMCMGPVSMRGGWAPGKTNNVFQGHRHATTPSFSCDQRMHRPKHVLPNPDSLLDADGEGE